MYESRLDVEGLVVLIGDEGVQLVNVSTDPFTLAHSLSFSPGNLNLNLLKCEDKMYAGAFSTDKKYFYTAGSQYVLRALGINANSTLTNVSTTSFDGKANVNLFDVE